MDLNHASSSQVSRHHSPSNCSTFSENDAEQTFNFNLTNQQFVNTFTIKVERDVAESYDEQIRNDDTNLQHIESEPQFCITDENDFIAPGSDVTIKTETEDIAADESCSNLYHVPFTSIHVNNLQDEGQMQNELTSELIIKSEHNNDVEETQNVADYVNDISSGTGQEAYVTPVFQFGKQFVERGHSMGAVDSMYLNTCPICGRVYKYRPYFTDHMIAHENKEINDEGLFECEVCKKKFIKKDKLKIHKKKHLLNITLSKCIHCDQKFRTEYLKQHIKNVHSTDYPFHCSICSKSFKTKSNLTIHLDVHSDVRAFKCDKCNKSFKKKEALSKHVLFYHTDERQYKCHECNKTYKTSHCLSQHIKTHSQLKLFACEVCGKMFKSKNHVQKHMHVHNIELNFKCEQCNKMFKSQPLLYHHIKTHTNVKPFECLQCNARFTTKNSLVRHDLSVHSDIRPFSCDICAKSFVTRTKLKQHGTVHNKTYDFKCKLCDAKYKRKEHLANHIKIKHSDTSQFKCNECEKSFEVKTNLLNHIKTHLNLNHEGRISPYLS